MTTPQDETEEYEIINYEGLSSTKLGGPKAKEKPPTRRQPKIRVKWVQVGIRGEVECQLCGTPALSRNGMLLHEYYYHSGNEGIRATVFDMEQQIDEMIYTFEQLPKQAAKIGWLGPQWWRERKWRR